MFFSPLKMTFWAKHMSGHWNRVKQRCDVTGCIHVGKNKELLSYFQHFRRSYFHKMIAFSHFIFALIYHSCAVQMLEKVIGYFLSLKNDCCRKHELNSLVLCWT